MFELKVYFSFLCCDQQFVAVDLDQFLKFLWSTGYATVFDVLILVCSAGDGCDCVHPYRGATCEELDPCEHTDCNGQCNANGAGMTSLLLKRHVTTATFN